MKIDKDKIKDIGFWTNPFILIGSIPVMGGFLLSAMSYGTINNMRKIIGNL